MNERVAIGGGSTPREAGTIAAVTDAWRDRDRSCGARPHMTS